MTETELQTALEHDAAMREGRAGVARPMVLAAECLRNAAVAARGAECALMICDPPGVVEARKAAQLALLSLESALTLMATEMPPNE